MSIIFVTNNNDFHHTDRYDGEDYEFPPGEAVPVPDEAATLMLGYNLKDKTSTLQRLGWAMRFDEEKENFVEDEEGVRKLANFTFEPGTFTRASQVASALA